MNRNTKGEWANLEAGYYWVCFEWCRNDPEPAAWNGDEWTRIGFETGWKDQVVLVVDRIKPPRVAPLTRLSA